jgi:hypothetical protein
MLKAKHHAVRIFVLFFLFLLVLPIVFSQPPFTTQSQTDIKGLTIVYPKIDIYQKENITLNFDVLNEDLIKLDNTTTSCSYVFVDDTGTQIDSGNLLYSSYWFFEYNNPKEGEYNYYVYCTNTTDRGFVSSSFEIREGGTQLYNSPESWLPIIIGFAIFVSLILIVSFNIKEPLLEGIKTFTFLLGLVDAFLLFLFIWMVSNNPINPSISNNFLLGFVISHGLALITIIWMYGAFLVERRMRKMNDD